MIRNLKVAFFGCMACEPDDGADTKQGTIENAR